MKHEILLIVILLVLHPILSYADQDTGSIQIDVKYTNGDRAGNDMVLKIYQDFTKTPYKIIESLPENPYVISSLPTGHRYTVESYVNSMYASVGFVNLQSNQQRLDMIIPLSGGIRFNVFFEDGTTPLEGATVLIKSHDEKQWGKRVTDDQGKTQRIWIQSTTQDSDYYVADIMLGNDIKYTYSPIKLRPGGQQDYKVITPWPSIITDLVIAYVYDTAYTKVSKSHEVFVVELYNSNGNKVAESPVNIRGEAFFSNLKVDTYDFHVKKIEGTLREDWGSKKITIVGSQKPVEIFRTMQQSTIEKLDRIENSAQNPIPGCECVAFRLDNLQDYWLSNVQIGVIEAFQKKNASLTVGIIGNYFGSDPKITNFVKEKVSKNNPAIEVAINGWELEDFSKFSKDQQSSLLQKSNERISSILGVSPVVFIPPDGRMNDETLVAAQNAGIRYISAHTRTDSPPYLLSDLAVYRFPITVLIDGVTSGSSTQTISYDKALDAIKKSVNNYGFAVAKINLQDYAVNNGTKLENTLNSEHIQKLESLIEQIRDSGLDIVTISEINLDHSSSIPIIPSWIKNNAGWWAEGKILDSDFISGIEHMIHKKIITIKNLPISGQQGTKSIPTWVKNNAGWWAEDRITESDFVKGIEFLVKNGIIKV